MSCKKGKKYLNKYGVEFTSKCSYTFDVNKQCKCYASINSQFPDEEQFCGFEENGKVFPCDIGCCDDGCPGQCPGIKPRPPYAIRRKMRTKDTEIRKYIKLILTVLVYLIILSTISLFI